MEVKWEKGKKELKLSLLRELAPGTLFRKDESSGNHSSLPYTIYMVMGRERRQPCSRCGTSPRDGVIRCASVMNGSISHQGEDKPVVLVDAYLQVNDWGTGTYPKEKSHE